MLKQNVLPKTFLSFFGPNNQRLIRRPQSILSEGSRFVIETSAGKVIRLKPGKIDFYKETPSALGWVVKSTSCQGPIGPCDISSNVVDYKHLRR